MSTPRLASLFGNALVVLVLTVLTWIYADRQGEAVRSVSFPLQVVAREGTDQFVLHKDGPTTLVTLTIRGPSARVDQLIETLTADTVRVYLPEITVIGEDRQRIKDLLEFNLRLSQRGITIERHEPPTVNVEIDRYVSLTRPVRLAPDVLERVTGNYRVDPPDISIRLPGRLSEQIPPEIRLDLLSRLTAGVTRLDEQIPIELDLPAAANHDVRIDPASVRVQLAVTVPMDRQVIGPIEVQFMGPRVSWARYAIEAEPDATRINLTFLVPQGSQAAERQVTAYIDLTDNPPIPGETVSRRVRINAPADWRLASPEPEVRFRLIALDEIEQPLNGPAMSTQPGL